jgi:hypothetical protein
VVIKTVFEADRLILHGISSPPIDQLYLNQDFSVLSFDSQDEEESRQQEQA